MDVLYGVRMTGPLAPYARGLAGELARLGFTELLGTVPAGAGRASEPVACRGWAGHGGADRRRWWMRIWRHGGRPGIRAYLTPKALAPLLGYLRGLGVAPQPEVPAPQTPAEELAERLSPLAAGRARPCG